MHRIDHVTASKNHNGAGKNGFTEGDPVGGVAPTVVTDDWLNDVQENVCEVIEAEGITLVKADGSQLNDAIESKLETRVRRLFASTASATQRTTPGDFDTTYTIPGGFLAVGDLLHVRAFGHVVPGSTNPLVVGIKFRAALMNSLTSTTIPGDGNTHRWKAEWVLTVEAIGGSARVRGYSEMDLAGYVAAPTVPRDFSVASPSPSTFDSDTATTLAVNVDQSGGFLSWDLWGLQVHWARAVA